MGVVRFACIINVYTYAGTALYVLNYAIKRFFTTILTVIFTTR